MALTVEQKGSASLIVRDGVETVCEIRDMRLCNARFRPEGAILIGETVPLPLFWEQYAHHEDPERNGGNYGTAELLSSDPDAVQIRCTGSTLSRSVRSVCNLTVARVGNPVRYEFTVRTSMSVEEGGKWRVTPNPQQGELEFCNLWPEGVYAADPAVPLRYQGLFVRQETRTIRIPHHHLNTPDKENIRLSGGDRFAWLLEEENLCCTILDSPPVTAALCAYMWDFHLAYRVCHDGKEILLPGGTTACAAFRLSSLTEEEGRRFMEGAVEDGSTASVVVPVYGNGIVLLSGLHRLGSSESAALWPWEQEVLRGNPKEVRFTTDGNLPPGGAPALTIASESPVHAAWRVSGFGPAYRQPAFPKDARYRLCGRVSGLLASGHAALSVRLHREGRPGLFDTSEYEIFTTRTGPAIAEWVAIDVLTPPVSPAPDRLHILLELNGAGTVSFADIHFEHLE